MKLSINEATCMKNSTLENDLILADKYEYEYIELRIDMLRHYLDTHSFKDLKNLISKHKVKIAGYNSIENINFTDESKETQITQDIEFVCKMKKLIGGELLVVVPTVTNEMIWSSEEIKTNSVEVLKRIVQKTEQDQIKIAFEPIGSKTCCVRSLELAYQIVSEVNHPLVGLVIDAFNLFMFDGWKDFTVLEKIEVEKIFVYHINDSDSLPLHLLNHSHRIFPGNGMIPLSKISLTLHEKGYDGVCSLELFNPGYWQMNPEDVFKIGAQKTRMFL